MPNFHRSSVPTYFGGLPSGYDYINNPALNGDAGVAAFADGKKSSGVNAGTYYVSFGEDATSNDTNRGIQALADNTDTLDNILRRDLAITARTSDVTAGSPVSSVVIAGQIFVGAFGVPNTQDQRDQLVSVLDNNDEEILVGATKLVASLIQDGVSNNVVGTQTSGFYSSPTVNFNVSIPAGTTYRIYYGVRSNLATLPLDAFTNIKIRGAQEVDADVERVLRDLHSTLTGTNWDDAWTATVNSLARTGLDGRYRLTTNDPGASPAVNVPGAGGTITRDGPALAISCPSIDLTAIGTSGVSHYPDPLLASWRVKRAATTVGTTYNLAFGGDVGLLQESTMHNYTDASEVAFTHVSNSLLMDVIPRSITASTLATHAVLTRINAAAVASVNPSGLTDATSRRTIQLASGDFITNGSGHIGFRVTDLLEVTDNATNIVVGTFMLDSILSTTSFTVKTVTGALPPLGPSGSAAAIRVRWLQVAVAIGGQNLNAKAGDVHGIPQFFIAQPGLLTEDSDSNIMNPAAVFLSAVGYRSTSPIDDVFYKALAWGGFDQVGEYALAGTLLGDGGIFTKGGRQTMNLPNRRQVLDFVITAGSHTLSWDPTTHGSSINVHWDTGLTSSAALTFAIDTSAGYLPTNGDQFSLLIQMAPGTTAPITWTWPGNFIFSGTDGIPPVNNFSSTLFANVRYDFEYQVTTAGGGWWAKRADY